MFKNGFEKKLIPTVVHGDDENLQNTNSILIDFANYLINPKMDKLVLVKEMISKLPFTEDKLPVYSLRVKKLVAYPIVKHAIAIGTGLAV